MDFLHIFSINNFIFFLILAIVFAASFKYGRKLAMVLILATYPTILIFKNLTFLSLENKTTALIMLVIIFALSIFTFWVNLNPHSTYNNARKIFEYALLSLAFMILLSGATGNSLSLVNSFIDLGSITVFINKYISYGFALIIPIIAILITNKRGIY